MNQAASRQLWARHVEQARHYSHTDKGQPLFEEVFDRRKQLIELKCTSPGCTWRLADESNRVRPKKQEKR